MRIPQAARIIGPKGGTVLPYWEVTYDGQVVGYIVQQLPVPVPNAKGYNPTWVSHFALVHREGGVVTIFSKFIAACSQARKERFTCASR